MKPITKAEAKKMWIKLTGKDENLKAVFYLIDEIYDSLKELKMEEKVDCEDYCCDSAHQDGFNQAVKEINLKIDNLCLNTKP